MNIISLPRRLRPFAAALGALAVLLLAAPAQAGNIWVVKTALSPSTGLPITGGGSWIVNKPSGYYLGRAVAGSRFDVVETSGANWHYGRAITTVNMCGWVMPGSMDYQAGSQADSCSAATKDMLSHRQNIGKNYNAPAHQAGDGSAVATSGSCPLYYNYFYGTSFGGGANGGHWANFAGTASTTVYYRFTTLDGGAAVVRDPVLGWGFTVASCTGRPATVYNDGD